MRAALAMKVGGKFEIHDVVIDDPVGCLLYTSDAADE